MSHENVAVLRRLFKAVEDRDSTSYVGAYAAEIVIREAESLPYGGVYRGLHGVQQHAVGYTQTWDHLQTAAERTLDAVFLDAHDHVVVLWRQKARAPHGTTLDLPVVSVYTLRGGKVVEAQMFHLDTAALLRFLDTAAPHAG